MDLTFPVEVKGILLSITVKMLAWDSLNSSMEYCVECYKMFYGILCKVLQNVLQNIWKFYSPGPSKRALVLDSPTELRAVQVYSPSSSSLSALMVSVVIPLYWSYVDLYLCLSTRGCPFLVHRISGGGFPDTLHSK